MHFHPDGISDNDKSILREISKFFFKIGRNIEIVTLPNKVISNRTKSALFKGFGLFTKSVKSFGFGF